MVGNSSTDGAVSNKFYRRQNLPTVQKKAAQNDPENYLPVCLLSHVRKSIDAPVILNLNEQYVAASSQFGFQEKLYGKVDRRMLLEIMKAWWEEETTKSDTRYVGPNVDSIEERPY